MADSAYSKLPKAGSFRDLVVWQRAMDLVLRMHAVARLLPPFEQFELARDLRRSSRSIPANVAEGFNRYARASYRWHVSIALGSQGELETQLELARRLEYIDDTLARECFALVDEVGRLLQGLRRALAPKRE